VATPPDRASTGLQPPKVAKHPGVISKHHIDDFRAIAEDTFEAGIGASTPADALGGVATRIERTIFGAPIPEQFAAKERLDNVRGLAILSSDALSSVAYGTEASLAVLVAAGAVALATNLVIGGIIVVLMIVVANSYRQTIHAYPNGGGSYTVARENLGPLPGLIAAAALLVDYILTVSVSVAAGVDALASAFNQLNHWIVPIDLAVILFIVVVNLRGVRESGTFFAIPTYLFIASFGSMLILGFVHAVTQGGLLNAAPPQVSASATQSLGVMLILTAFASGCSAMTGVEAISNSVPAFQPPESKHAAQTLTTMISFLVLLFLGTTFLAWRFGVAPSPTGSPTVTAQIAHVAIPSVIGWFFYVVQIATLLILMFAANTSFNGFPRLASILARDNYLPAFFGYRGERLAYTIGIVVLGVVSAFILWVFQGNVTDLINLYALGVFTAFTLSQTGMVRHWLRLRGQERGWRGRLAANAVGAVATAVVTVVIAIAKFDRGAWVVLVLVPLLVLLFLGLHRYYKRPHIFQENIPVTQHVDVAIVPIIDMRDADPAVAFAARMAQHVMAVHIASSKEEADDFHRLWRQCEASAISTPSGTPQLEIVISPYRTIVLPLTNFILWQRERLPRDESVAVILPRRADPTWWDGPLHRRIARRVRHLLAVATAKHDISVINLPYRLGKR
jgi:amino acid transporter